MPFSEGGNQTTPFGFTFNIMLSLDTTVTVEPTGMSACSSDTARHSSPSILTYPLPPTGIGSITLASRPMSASALLLRSSPPLCSFRSNGGLTSNTHSSDATAHSSTCDQKGSPTAARTRENNAPMEKQTKYKSPPVSSEIRHTKLSVSHRIHRF